MKRSDWLVAEAGTVIVGIIMHVGIGPFKCCAC